tara:strand:+ start:1548 stop:1802 length:255 start_codon:yes stop_codon:yes gene_type:complete
MTPRKKIKTGSIAWTILNYVVNEPGEWTLPSIVKDMGGATKSYASVRTDLIKVEYILSNDSSGNFGAHKLIPTPEGIEAFSKAE